MLKLILWSILAFQLVMFSLVYILQTLTPSIVLLWLDAFVIIPLVGQILIGRALKGREPIYKSLLNHLRGVKYE